jgi:TonB family protein
MASHHLTPEPESASPRSAPTNMGLKPKPPLAQNVAVLISVLVHGIAMLAIGLSALLAPHRPSAIPVFEIVSLEKPKLRPLRPKVQPPPEPPPPEPEPVRPPEAPKLTAKPTDAVTVKKPEPKVVKEVEDKTEPVKEVVHEEQVLQPQVAMTVPQDPRLSLWAARVKKKVDQLWNPPSGIEISGKVKAVVTFKVSRDGTVNSPSISEASGSSVLDELALMTIKRLETVPPIPENFPNDELEVGCEFPYQGQ